MSTDNKLSDDELLCVSDRNYPPTGSKVCSELSTCDIGNIFDL